MVIRTQTPELEKCRRMLLRLLAQTYPAHAVKRDQLRPFHRLVPTYGLENDLNGKSQATLVGDSHACIHVDMSLCMSMPETP